MLDLLLSKTALKLAAAAVAVGAVAYGVHSYNTWVSAEAVAKVDAEFTVKFNDIEQQAKDLKLMIEANAANVKLAQAKAIATEQEKANEATRKYRAAIIENKAMAQERNAAIAASGDLLGKLLNASTASVGAHPECPTISRYTDDLSTRYAACERDLAEAVGEAAKALDRASAAEAAVRALTLKDKQ